MAQDTQMRCSGAINVECVGVRDDNDADLSQPHTWILRAAEQL